VAVEAEAVPGLRAATEAYHREMQALAAKVLPLSFGASVATS
jgi:isopenicillin N synthase-like dioxygenase